MSAARCMCEFDSSDCGGLGVIYCSGCGGDLCVCAACNGDGERECPGCDLCGDDSSQMPEGEEDSP